MFLEHPEEDKLKNIDRDEFFESMEKLIPCKADLHEKNEEKKQVKIGDNHERTS